MNTALDMFKIDLGITHNLRDTYFTNLLTAYNDELSRKGINLDLTNTEDIMLLVDFSVYNYKHRNEAVELSKNLRNRILNRQVKGRADNAE